MILSLVGVILGLFAAFFSYVLRSNQAAQHIGDFVADKVMIESAVETFATVVKYSEAHYMLATRQCQGGRLFFAALGKNGDGCASAGNVNIFTSDDLKPLQGQANGLISFRGGWSLSETSSTIPSDHVVATIPVDYGKRTVKIIYAGSFAARNRADFFAQMERDGHVLTRERFDIAGEDISSMVYLRTSDSTVLAGAMSWSEDCANMPFQPLQIWDGTSCHTIQNLTAGSGLANFGGSYFALRPQTGEVVYFDPGGVGRTVNQDGTYNGKSIFPAYSQNALINVDDFEVQGRNPAKAEVITVGNSGAQALSYMDVSTQTRRPLCKLAEQGVAIAANGLAKVSSNQMLTDTGTNFTAAVSSFLVKTDGGQVFYVLVLASKSSTALESQYTVHDTKLNRYYSCALKVYPLEAPDTTLITGAIAGMDESQKSYVFF